MSLFIDHMSTYAKKYQELYIKTTRTNVSLTRLQVTDHSRKIHMLAIQIKIKINTIQSSIRKHKTSRNEADEMHIRLV